MSVREYSHLFNIFNEYIVLVFLIMICDIFNPQSTLAYSLIYLIFRPHKWYFFKPIMFYTSARDENSLFLSGLLKFYNHPCQILFLIKYRPLNSSQTETLLKGKNLASQRFLLIRTPVYVSDYSGVKFISFALKNTVT